MCFVRGCVSACDRRMRDASSGVVAAASLVRVSPSSAGIRVPWCAACQAPAARRSPRGAWAWAETKPAGVATSWATCPQRSENRTIGGVSSIDGRVVCARVKCERVLTSMAITCLILSAITCQPQRVPIPFASHKESPSDGEPVPPAVGASPQDPRPRPPVRLLALDARALLGPRGRARRVL